MTEPVKPPTKEPAKPRTAREELAHTLPKRTFWAGVQVGIFSVGSLLGFGLGDPAMGTVALIGAILMVVVAINITHKDRL